MKTLGYITSFVVYMFAASAWSGYVLSILWAWFVVAQFRDAPALSVPGAIGIALIVRYLTNDLRYEPNKDDEERKARIVYGVVVSFVAPLFALGFGWVVRGFI